MFGNRKRMSADEIKSMKEQVDQDIVFYHQLADAQGQMNANISEIKDSRRQVEQEVSQINDNISYGITHIQDNINAEASMIYELENMSRELKMTSQDFESLKQSIGKNYEETVNVVDANKHFTTPSKMLQDLPGELKEQNKLYSKQIEYMAEYSKQMSVLALNAAIEAGRMGDGAMQFVDAAEQIRNYVSNYNNCIEEVKKNIDEHNERIDRMEEQIKHLITQLKDNNVATGKLLKRCGDIKNASDKISFEEYPDRIEASRNELIGVKNTNEELLKTEERNRMQIGDVEAEFEIQIKNESEYLGAVEPFLEKAKAMADANKLEVEEL